MTAEWFARLLDWRSLGKRCRIHSGWTLHVAAGGTPARFGRWVARMWQGFFGATRQGRREPQSPKAWSPSSSTASFALSRLALFAILFVLVNQDLARDDAWVGRPPRDDCCREGLTLENRLVAPCTGPRLTHVVPLPNQPILPLGKGRGVARRLGG